MHTTIRIKISPSMMFELYDKSELVNVRFYEALNYVDSPDHKQYYNITIRHQEDQNPRAIIRDAISQLKKDVVKEPVEKYKIFQVDFKGYFPVGNCLIIAAKDIKQAEKLAIETLGNLKLKSIKEIIVDKVPKVIEFLDGDY